MTEAQRERLRQGAISAGEAVRLHIYRARVQPATRYVIDMGGCRRYWIRHADRRVLRCLVCGRQRWARSLVVQVFYDGARFYCRDRDRCRRKGDK